MNVLIINHGIPPEFNAGSEVYTIGLSQELSKYHNVYLVSRTEDPLMEDFAFYLDKIEGNLFYYKINNPRGKDGYQHFRMDKKFENFLNSLQIEIAHIGHLNHLSTGFIDVLYSKKIPIVYTLHDFWLICPRGQFLQTNFSENFNYSLCDKQEDEKCAVNCYNSYFSGIDSNRDSEIQYWKNWVHGRMETTLKILKKVNLFISPSHYLKNRFIKNFPFLKEKILYMDYGFSIDCNTSNKSINHLEEFTFGYIGTHIPAKGIQILVDAFLKMEHQAKLMIWGRCNNSVSQSLKGITLNSNKSQKITWMGEYKNSEINERVFTEVDCIVVPSIWAENSPLVIHEAQANKIPVITANYGGMAEYVKDLENGLLFEHRNSEDLSKKMDYAVLNQTQMKKLGERGYLFSEDGKIPSMDEHCKQIMNLYYELINLH
jgi:glycosyltransferase involved in cell wall biosynthesis